MEKLTIGLALGFLLGRIIAAVIVGFRPQKKDPMIPNGLSQKEEARFVRKYRIDNNFDSEDIWHIKLSDGKNLYDIDPDKISADQFYSKK